MLQGDPAITDALSVIETALQGRRASLTRLGDEIRALEQAATALRHVAPLPGEPLGRPKAPRGPVARRVASEALQASMPTATVPAVPHTAPEGASPEVRARRARVVSALPMVDAVKCADLARRLGLAQAHVQTDLEALLAKGFAQRTGWGRWKRATEEVVVFSGRDSLILDAPDAMRARA